MSNHFILIYDPPWAGPTAKRIKGNNIDLSRGRIEQIDDPYEFLLQVDKHSNNSTIFPPLDFHRSSGQCLFSAKFQEALNYVGIDNIQFFPTKVIYEPTGKEYDYKVGNVIGLVKALDITASQCIVDEDGFVDDFKLMVFDEKKLPPALNIFRLYEMMSIIVITQRAAHILNQFKLTGIRIMAPSEWQPGII
jgi:hypothetical protein